MATRSRLSLYGEPIFRWRGTGTLSRNDGSRERVSFTSRQLKDGSIIIETRGTRIPLFESRAIELLGLTHNGDKIAFSISSLSFSNASLGQRRRHQSVTAYWFARDVRVTHQTKGQLHELVAGVVNCDLGPSREVTIRIGRSAVQLKRRIDYEAALAQAKYQDSAILTVNVHSLLGQSSVVRRLQQIEDICTLVSFARGTTVNWIYYEARDSHGAIVESVHGHRVTRPFSSIAPIPLDQIVEFVRCTLPVLRADRLYRFRRAINAVHDAKTGSFLETKGLAACVLIEYFVTRYGTTQPKKWRKKTLLHRLNEMNSRESLGFQPSSILWFITEERTCPFGELSSHTGQLETVSPRRHANGHYAVSTLGLQGISREPPARMGPMSQQTRCGWATGSSELMLRYHDEEWGVPVHDDGTHFEFLILEGAQAGLSWNTILNKREGYRRAFAGFDYKKVARYTDADVARLLGDAGIVRNKLKVASAISNAQALIALQGEFGSFDEYIWRFVGGPPKVNAWRSMRELPASTAESDAMSKDLRKRGSASSGARSATRTCRRQGS